MDARGWPHRGREKQLTRAASRTQTFTNRGRTLGDREGKKLDLSQPHCSFIFSLFVISALSFFTVHSSLFPRKKLSCFSVPPSFSSYYFSLQSLLVQMLRASPLCRVDSCARNEGRKEGRKVELSPLFSICSVSERICLPCSIIVSLLSLSPLIHLSLLQTTQSPSPSFRLFPFSFSTLSTASLCLLWKTEEMDCNLPVCRS